MPIIVVAQTLFPNSIGNLPLLKTFLISGWDAVWYLTPEIFFVILVINLTPQVLRLNDGLLKGF